MNDAFRKGPFGLRVCGGNRAAGFEVREPDAARAVILARDILEILHELRVLALAKEELRGLPEPDDRYAQDTHNEYERAAGVHLVPPAFIIFVRAGGGRRAAEVSCQHVQHRSGVPAKVHVDVRKNAHANKPATNWPTPHHAASNVRTHCC